MAATANDRNTAARFRKAVANGTATDIQRGWLANYDANKGSPGRKPRDVAQYGAPMTQPIATPPAPVNAPPTAPGPVTIDFGAPPDPGQALAPVVDTSTMCSEPNCPACRGNMGARRCVATGKLVFPPMSEDSAKTLAGALLYGIAFLAKMVRKDKLWTPPEAADTAKLAKAICDIQRNHFTWIGAGYEFFAFIGAVSSFGGRAFTRANPDATLSRNAPTLNRDENNATA